MSNEQRLEEAVGELNRRVSRIHRRLTLLTITVSAVSGLAAAALVMGSSFPSAAGGVGSFGWLAAFVMAAAGLTAAGVVFALSNRLARSNASSWQRRWLGELAREHGVDQAALAEMGLPIGYSTAPASSAASPNRQHRQQRLAIVVLMVGLGGATVVALVVDVAQEPRFILIAALFVAAAVIMNRYLGWRPPR